MSLCRDSLVGRVFWFVEFIGFIGFVAFIEFVGSLGSLLDNIILDVIRMNIFLRDGPVPGRDTCQMYGFHIPGNQGMPPVKLFAVTQQPVGTGFGKPAKLGHFCRRQLQAFPDKGHPVFIRTAAAVLGVQQVTGYVRVIDPAGFPVLQLLQAAKTATITQRFPLLTGQFLQGFYFPEGGLIIWHRTSMEGRKVKPVPFFNLTCYDNELIYKPSSINKYKFRDS